MCFGGGSKQPDPLPPPTIVPPPTKTAERLKPATARDKSDIKQRRGRNAFVINRGAEGVTTTGESGLNVT